MELPILADPDDLAESGWGVLFSRDEHPAVLHALGELLVHRREQAGNRYKELTYYPGESAKKFLWYRHGESPGIIDPEILPYYLLIVGDPETIPFEFQYELAASRAVGRIYFEDPSDYASYAQRVVDAEKDGIELPRRAVFFLPEHDNDSATKRLAQRYFQPLAENLSDYNSWTIDTRNKDQAYKANLRALLGGSQTPNLLVVACHGRRFPVGHPDQLARQGALICQDWTARTRLEEVHYLHAGDVTDTSNLKGLVAFLVASNSAGTPFVDDFPHETREGMIIGTPPAPRPLAMQPFIARLPQQLLRLGALAIVGHVDRNWTLSFEWTFKGTAGDSMRNFEESLRELLVGHPVGHAMRPLNRRAVDLAAQVGEIAQRIREKEPIDEEIYATLITAYRDARNYIVLGDPAARLLAGEFPDRQVSNTPRAEFRLFLPKELASSAVVAAKVSGVKVDRLLASLIERNLQHYLAHNADSPRRAPCSASADVSSVGGDPLDYLPILAEERPRVFISYAWENRRVVGRIRDGLIERGIDAWMDADPRKGIHGGQSIPGVVKRKITESRFSLVCFSSQALRKEGWVHQEWRWILERAGRMPPGQHYAIPIKLNRCEIPSDLDFEATRYLKLGRDLNRFLDQLAYEIHSHSGQHDAEK